MHIAVSITPYVDTDLSTDTGTSGGSRQTDSAGWGVYDAALDVRKQLFAAAAAKASADAKKANKPDPAVNAADLTIEGKFVKSTTDPAFQMSISSVVNSAGTTIIGRGVHRNETPSVIGVEQDDVSLDPELLQVQHPPLQMSEELWLETARVERPVSR